MIKITKFKLHTPLWLLTGAVCIMISIVGIMTFEAVNRQKQDSIRILTEKGAALIRSFEAGTRTGMIGMQWGHRLLQKLLTATAQQPDIDYILVSDVNGNIVAHSNIYMIGMSHSFDIKKVLNPDKLNKRIITGLSKKVFEVFRTFKPSGRDKNMHIPPHLMFPKCFKPPPKHKLDLKDNSPLMIFVGLDMTSIENARQSEKRRILAGGIILLLAGFTGIALLYVVQNYRSSISKIKAFSDTIVENIPIGLIALDKETKVASLNYVAENILNIKPDQTIGKYAEQILPQDMLNELNHVALKHKKIEKEIDCLLSDNIRIPLEFSASCLEDNDKKVLGYVLLFKDLREIRSLRQKIAQNQRLASIGRLAAGVAHEIRNPLSSIKGFAVYFKERYADVEQDEKIALIMIQEVDRLNRVVSQLLEFTRPVNISKKPVDISQLIKSVLEVVGPRLIENKIKVKTEIPEKNCITEIDPDRIKEVFLNLFLNSIEAMKDSGTLCVSILIDKNKQWFQIKVSDTGTGINKENISNIFEPYFTTKSSGTGLGLAIVHNTIEAHEGKIEVETKEGEGTGIIIYLPYRFS